MFVGTGRICKFVQKFFAFLFSHLFCMIRAGDLLSMARQRHSKIERFKQEKEIEKRLQELSAEVEKPHVDEDVKVRPNKINYMFLRH